MQILFIKHLERKIIYMDKSKQEIIEEQNLFCDLEVDGGIHLGNVADVLEAGANVVVAGTAVFGGEIPKNVSEFLKVMK